MNSPHHVWCMTMWVMEMTKYNSLCVYVCVYMFNILCFIDRLMSYDQPYKVADFVLVNCILLLLFLLCSIRPLGHHRMCKLKESLFLTRTDSIVTWSIRLISSVFFLGRLSGNYPTFTKYHNLYLIRYKSIVTSYKLWYFFESRVGA
jgi:hypothetical protein